MRMTVPQPMLTCLIFEFGVECREEDLRQPGEKRDCHPREGSEYISAVSSYVDFLKGLKPHPNMVMVAGIVGNSEPVVVRQDSYGPRLEYSCTSSAGEATPAVRLQAFFDAFPARNVASTICNEDFSNALSHIAELLHSGMGSSCLRGFIADQSVQAAGTQPSCKVYDVRQSDTGSEIRTILAACDESGDVSSCWQVYEDASSCEHTQTHLSVSISRQDTAPPGTHVEVHCVIEQT